MRHAQLTIGEWLQDLWEGSGGMNSPASLPNHTVSSTAPALYTDIIFVTWFPHLHFRYRAIFLVPPPVSKRCYLNIKCI